MASPYKLSGLVTGRVLFGAGIRVGLIVRLRLLLLGKTFGAVVNRLGSYLIIANVDENPADLRDLPVTSIATHGCFLGGMPMGLTAASASTSTTVRSPVA